MSERQTQDEKLLAYLRKAQGMWVSARTIVEGTDILCYTRRITTLRRAGHDIQIRWLKTYGGTRYSEYRLVENG